MRLGPSAHGASAGVDAERAVGILLACNDTVCRAMGQGPWSGRSRTAASQRIRCPCSATCTGTRACCHCVPRKSTSFRSLRREKQQNTMSTDGWTTRWPRRSAQAHQTALHQLLTTAWSCDMQTSPQTYFARFSTSCRIPVGALILQQEPWRRQLRPPPKLLKAGAQLCHTSLAQNHTAQYPNCTPISLQLAACIFA